MDEFINQRIADFFEPWDLVEYLGISTAELIEAFESEIEERLDDIEEIMGVKREEPNE